MSGTESKTNGAPTAEPHADTHSPRSTAVEQRPIQGTLGLALPMPDLRHMRTMTDDTGILQHARYIVPDRNHGYCVDDNARALIVACRALALERERDPADLLAIYLAFMVHAFNEENGRFRNFMSYDRRWLEDAGSEDSHGRSLWGLGVATRTAPNGSQRMLATELFRRGLPAVEGFSSPRAWAFTLLGIDPFMEYHGDDPHARFLRGELAGRLMRLFDENCGDDWEWCENIMTYANAKIPASLIVSGRALGDERMLDRGLRSLKWLLRVQTASRGHVSLIGNARWMTRGGERSRFDQQAIDAMALVEGCVEAFKATGESEWMFNSLVALRWFLGYNDLGIPLYDESTGGCCDGLQPHGANANQGAESTLAWLMSVLAVRETGIARL